MWYKTRLSHALWWSSWMLDNDSACMIVLNTTGPYILFCSILFFSFLFYSILFYSILFYSILFYSVGWGPWLQVLLARMVHVYMMGQNTVGSMWTRSPNRLVFTRILLISHPNLNILNAGLLNLGEITGKIRILPCDLIKN